MEMFKLFLCSIFGMTIHSCMKFKDIQNLSKKANSPISLKSFIKEDAASIIMSFASCGLWIILFGEIACKYPQLNTFKYSSFAALGGFNSYIIQKVFSAASRRINSIIDEKTDIADDKK